MKKAFGFVLICAFFTAFFSSCIQNGKNRTIDAKMTIQVAQSGQKPTTFTATQIQPSLVTSQISDTSTSIVISGYDQVSGDKIVISVKKYTEQQGTFSIANGDASGVYYHNGIPDIAASGIVAFKEITSNTIVGYFSMTTAGGYDMTNGDFIVGKPWNY